MGMSDGGREAAARAVIVSPRPLLAGLTCLGAHEDVNQRSLLLVSVLSSLERHACT